MIDIVPPQTAGEWLSWASALVTILFGFICLLMPRLTLKLLRLQTLPDVPEAVAESRATMAGFYLGTGVIAILFNQPFIWLVLGAGWAFTAIGRLVSIMVDRGNTTFNWISIFVEAALAAGPIFFVFGIVP